MIHLMSPDLTGPGVTGSGLAELAAALASGDEPGLAIGVYARGELAASATAGCGLPEHGVLVTETTAFDIASVSKHMTSACLLLLARDGLVDLDADIRASLPELSLTRPVTLRQCLTHTAGLRDYFALCDMAGIGVLGITQDRFMDLATGQEDLDFAPGSAFSYSNTGYALAATLVSRVTGAGLARFAAKHVFGPLGMTATHFRDDVSLLVPGLAGGYIATGTGVARFRRYDVTEEVVGDGAVVTTLTDLAAWHAFMATGAVLGTDIRDGLLASQVLTDGTDTGYGLGLQLIDVAGQPAWWHSGSWAGYRAAVIYLPGPGSGVSVLANRNDRYASYVALAVASTLVGGGDPVSAYRALADQSAPAERAREQAREISGRWHEPDQDVYLRFDAEQDQVVLREHGEELRFALGADGDWHGIGPAAGGTYRLCDGVLIADWGLSARADGRYRRAGALPDGSAPRAVPAGIFRNEELGADAEIRAGDRGAAEIRIGLAEPRPLTPAGDGVWLAAGGAFPAGGTLTVRLDGSALLISGPGARRVRFGLVPGAQAGLPVMRGLRGAR
jgi:CubicO group peptidase (beta-lactamase class C family)